MKNGEKTNEDIYWWFYFWPLKTRCFWYIKKSNISLNFLYYNSIMLIKSIFLLLLFYYFFLFWVDFVISFNFYLDLGIVYVWMHIRYTSRPLYVNPKSTNYTKSLSDKHTLIIFVFWISSIIILINRKSSKSHWILYFNYILLYCLAVMLGASLLIHEKWFSKQSNIVRAFKGGVQSVSKFGNLWTHIEGIR